MALDKKLTLGGLVAPPGTEFHNGFWTCGAGCPHPRECLVNEHCERGFVGNAVGFTGGTEKSMALDKKMTLDDLVLVLSDVGVRETRFEKWFKMLDIPNNDARCARLKAAFDAGWEARKDFGLDKPKAE